MEADSLDLAVKLAALGFRKQLKLEEWELVGWEKLLEIADLIGCC